MYYDRESKEVKIIDLATGKATFPFRELKDQFGISVSANFLFAEKINATEYILTTKESGIYIYDHAQGRIYNHKHHFADNTSIGNNITSTLEVSRSGWVFIDCNPTGISYYNSNEIVNNQNVFTDHLGNGYDGFIAGIATRDNNTYYIGTAEGLLAWKRNTNTTHFLHYTDEKKEPLPAPQEIVSIVIDSLGQVWATTQNQGIIVIDKNERLLRHITNQGMTKYSIKQEHVSRLLIGPDGYVWATGRSGISRINPVNFEVDNFSGSFLSSLDRTGSPISAPDMGERSTASAKTANPSFTTRSRKWMSPAWPKTARASCSPGRLRTARSTRSPARTREKPFSTRKKNISGTWPFQRPGF
jgi:hypothetical protein